MINEITVHPKPSNNNAKLATGIFGAIAIVGFTAYFLMSNYELPYRSVVGLCSLVFLVITIMLMTRYLFASLRYDVLNDSEGAAFFLIRQVTGKRDRALSRFYLADVAAIERETKEERGSYKLEDGFVKYSYMPTLGPKENIRITVRSRYERAVVRIEGSDEYLEALRGMIAEAKAIRAREEEEEEY